MYLGGYPHQYRRAGRAPARDVCVHPMAVFGCSFVGPAAGFPDTRPAWVLRIIENVLGRGDNSAGYGQQHSSNEVDTQEDDEDDDDRE